MFLIRLTSDSDNLGWITSIRQTLIKMVLNQNEKMVNNLESNSLQLWSIIKYGRLAQLTTSRFQIYTVIKVSYKGKQKKTNRLWRRWLCRKQYSALVRIKTQVYAINQIHTPSSFFPSLSLSLSLSANQSNKMPTETHSTTEQLAV